MASLYQILKCGGVCLVFRAELHGAMSKDVTIFCFTLWKKKEEKNVQATFYSLRLFFIYLQPS